MSFSSLPETPSVQPAGDRTRRWFRWFIWIGLIHPWLTALAIQFVLLAQSNRSTWLTPTDLIALKDGPGFAVIVTLTGFLPFVIYAYLARYWLTPGNWHPRQIKHFLQISLVFIAFLLLFTALFDIVLILPLIMIMIYHFILGVPFSLVCLICWKFLRLSPEWAVAAGAIGLLLITVYFDLNLWWSSSEAGKWAVQLYVYGGLIMGGTIGAALGMLLLVFGVTSMAIATRIALVVVRLTGKFHRK